MAPIEILYVVIGLVLIILGSVGHRRGWWSYAIYFFAFSSMGVFLVGLATAAYFFPNMGFAEQALRSLGYTVFSLFMFRIFWRRGIEADQKKQQDS